jgi:nitrate reductase gamma subunit
MLARMGLGLFTWLLVTCWPASPLALALMDKDHPFVAFTNDLLGLLMLLGIVLATLQRLVVRPAHVRSEWQDGLALLILGLMTVLGFLVEAVRLATSALPADTAWMSFVAYPLSVMLGGDPAAYAGAFGWLWWAHAACAALFVAWIPFGKMRHIFAAPLSLLLNRERA